jgi:hypothetical protein
MLKRLWYRLVSFFTGKKYYVPLYLQEKLVLDMIARNILTVNEGMRFFATLQPEAVSLRHLNEQRTNEKVLLPIIKKYHDPVVLKKVSDFYKSEAWKEPIGVDNMPIVGLHVSLAKEPLIRIPPLKGSKAKEQMSNILYRKERG